MKNYEEIETEGKKTSKLLLGPCHAIFNLWEPDQKQYLAL